MNTVSPSEFKKGIVLMLDGLPHRLEEFHSSGAAKVKPRVHGKLRNLKTGKLSERIFADNERLPVAELEQRGIQLSYLQDENYVFSDSETFEEVILSKELLGDRSGFVVEDQDYRALMLEGQVLDIVLPQQLVLEVTETTPAVHGTADSNWKPAKLQTGLELMVPQFIAPGERIRVDTHERKYAGRET